MLPSDALKDVSWWTLVDQVSQLKSSARDLQISSGLMSKAKVVNQKNTTSISPVLLKFGNTEKAAGEYLTGGSLSLLRRDGPGGPAQLRILLILVSSRTSSPSDLPRVVVSR